ncbi:T-complex protein 1 subunit eta isoform X1 [Harpegnathos saltator]|nr:T-complex protein 1 subunit eta isoform X1 [Harpegnathos saltator]
MKPFIEDGVHSHIIIKALRRALQIAIDKINALSVRINKNNLNKQIVLLEKCAATSMSSKLINHQKSYFSKLVVKAVLTLDNSLPLNMIGIKKVSGGALENSELIEGIAFKKTFSYAGFEMQPKRYYSCKIALLNIELELKAEKNNAEVRVDNVVEYQKIVDAEWKILYDKLDRIYKSGAKIVLSQLPIGDVATQYFADKDMFCAGRVQDEDLKRTLKAYGGAILVTVHDIKDSDLGMCKIFEEKQIGNERFNILYECSGTKTCTFILRGGTKQFLDETERSLHDAIMVVRRMIKNNAVVGGGGAIEMELSKILRDYSRNIVGKEQFLIMAIAKAYEVIPRQLCDNAGFDATNILNKLRQKHAMGMSWYGVDINSETVVTNIYDCIWEPTTIKINVLTAATKAACLILSIDETVKNPKSIQDTSQTPASKKLVRRGIGRPM